MGKYLIKCLIGLLIAAMFGMTGCGKTYRWSSLAGKQCFYQCQAENNRCLSGCNRYCNNNVNCNLNNLSCTLNCKSYGENCLAACPDLEEVVNTQKVEITIETNDTKNNRQPETNIDTQKAANIQKDVGIIDEISEKRDGQSVTNKKSQIVVNPQKTEANAETTEEKCEEPSGSITGTQDVIAWAKDGNIAGKEMDWNDALKWVKNLNYSGHNDWRLPTKNELTFLMEQSGKIPPYRWLNANGFINAQSDYYWSCNKNIGSTNEAWSVNFFKGHVNPLNKSGRNYVWPVRDKIK